MKEQENKVMETKDVEFDLEQVDGDVAGGTCKLSVIEREQFFKPVGKSRVTSIDYVSYEQEVE